MSDRMVSAVVVGRRERRPAIAVDLLTALLGSLLIALCAKIRIGGPVPFTMQSWAVMVLAASLGARRGALAVGAYLLEGLAGIPVFAGPTAGPAYLLGPTGGFLVGFLPAALLIGYLSERSGRRFSALVLALAIGDALLLAFGTGWLAVLIGAKAAIQTMLKPIVLTEGLKVLLAAALLSGLRRTGQPRSS